MKRYVPGSSSIRSSARRFSACSIGAPGDPHPGGVETIGELVANQLELPEVEQPRRRRRPATGWSRPPIGKAVTNASDSSRSSRAIWPAACGGRHARRLGDRPPEPVRRRRSQA